MGSQNDSRSRSPPRQSKKITGFKWKDKQSRNAEDVKPEQRAGGTLDRGYRDRSPPRHRRREGSRDRESHGHRRYRSRDRDDDRSGRSKDHRHDRNRRLRSMSRDRDDDRTRSANSRKDFQDDQVGNDDDLNRDRSPGTVEIQDKPAKEKKKKEKPPKTPVSNEPMIIVNINDRLGTKAAIPCFASDSIKGFKAMVAAHIGRKPHEILIKRQGERPMKDVLTLQDYGVSNGVQLDLELDTGD